MGVEELLVGFPGLRRADPGVRKHKVPSVVVEVLRPWCVPDRAFEVQGRQVSQRLTEGDPTEIPLLNR
jgi:hypothetical protein